VDNWLNWIGLAKRAGKLAPGHNQVQIALTNNKAHLVIIAQDAGESVYRKYHLWAQNLDVPLLQAGSMSDLGRAMGMGPHAVLAILDKQIASRLATQFGVPSGGMNFDRKRKSARIRISQGSEIGQPEVDRPASPASRGEHQESHEHSGTGRGANRAQHHGGKVAARNKNAGARRKRTSEEPGTGADRGDPT
jgi:ribosomal protein L7Ae-like RNA K-turn-binding protein